jgi:hypothetical protein
MSLFPEKDTTAVQCSIKFRELMKQRPDFWGENIVNSMKDCTESKEQIDFLRFLADPTGSVPGQNKDITTHTVDLDGDDFFKNPNFELISSEMGALPTFHFKYTPPTIDDEKVQS